MLGLLCILGTGLCSRKSLPILCSYSVLIWHTFVLMHYDTISDYMITYFFFYGISLPNLFIKIRMVLVYEASIQYFFLSSSQSEPYVLFTAYHPNATSYMKLYFYIGVLWDLSTVASEHITNI